jgi:hypothetical protein
MKKEKNIKKISNKLRRQADEKNSLDCQVIIDELTTASKDGEYVRTLELKINQAHYLEKLGLKVVPVEKRFGFYQISWK